jgi:hypothetical protein
MEEESEHQMALLDGPQQLNVALAPSVQTTMAPHTLGKKKRVAPPKDVHMNVVEQLREEQRREAHSRESFATLHGLWLSDKRWDRARAIDSNADVATLGFYTGVGVQPLAMAEAGFSVGGLCDFLPLAMRVWKHIFKEDVQTASNFDTERWKSWNLTNFKSMLIQTEPPLHSAFSSWKEETWGAQRCLEIQRHFGSSIET